MEMYSLSLTHKYSSDCYVEELTKSFLITVKFKKIRDDLNHDLRNAFIDWVSHLNYFFKSSRVNLHSIINLETLIRLKKITGDKVILSDNKISFPAIKTFSIDSQRQLSFFERIRTIGDRPSGVGIVEECRMCQLERSLLWQTYR